MLYGLDVPTDLVTTSGNAERFEDGAHRATCDDAGTRRRRAERHATGTEVTVAVVMQRPAVLQRHADHRLLGRGGRLGDRLGDFARLAVAEARTALAVADDDQRRKAEALAALHRLRDAVDVDQLLDQLFAAVVTRATAIATATIVVATATAARAAAIAAGATTTAAGTTTTADRATAVAAGTTGRRRLALLLPVRGFGRSGRAARCFRQP